MIPRAIRSRLSIFQQPNSLLRKNVPSKRYLIAAPKSSSGPLLERRADRELPEIPRNAWLRTIPIFLIIIGGSTLAIFNYQKSSSSVVSSTLYALRTNPDARRALGDEIYFKHKMPWIWGSINQMHGKIDITFSVKGTKGDGVMRFRSERRTRMGYFETLEWSLETPDGQKVSLLDSQGSDPFQGSMNKKEPT
ncbi:hypothetical protein FGG08_001176 [Glutinoglossum americanum]|uniref:Uncharacterized protein n=1 Tax=Glutinoglossum americanum TaxID=1670608 RepID=A0A9P8IDY2_9PEZI|nr:hypothetical protein FGG08_001176 [Glutinoglossum americanum]